MNCFEATLDNAVNLPWSFFDTLSIFKMVESVNVLRL